jgi:hypothetical protein
MLDTNDKKYCVYMHVNIHNDKKYIGMTCQVPEERWRSNGTSYLCKTEDGKYKNPAFANALNKYSDWHNDWRHIIVADSLTKEEAEQLEIELIALYKTNCYKYFNPSFGYNCTDGGEGGLGREWTEESKQKLSQSLKGHSTSDETKEKISLANTGRQFSDEIRMKFSEAHKGKNSGEEHYLWGQHQPESVRQKISQTKTGSRHSADTKAKMSESQKKRFSDPTNHPNYGRQLSEEHRKHIGEANVGRKMSEEAKRKIGEANSMPIVQLSKNGEFISIFSSVAKAEDITKVPHHVSDCCHRKRRTCGGYQWVPVYDIVLTNNEIIPGALTLGIVTEEQVREI